MEKRLSETEAADLLGVKSTTLQQWRTKKRGPTYFKVGHRVFYVREHLDAFMKARTREVKPAEER